MIMPGVQNPHWNPCAATNAACIGCKASRGPLPRTARAGQPLDGGDAAPLRAEGREQAAVDRLAVEMDGAGAAIAGIAALLDAEPAALAQQGAQALAGPRVHVLRMAVDDDPHPASLSSARISSASRPVTWRRQSGAPCTSSYQSASAIRVATASASSRALGGFGKARRTGRRVEAVTVTTSVAVRVARPDQQRAGAAVRAERDPAEGRTPRQGRRRHVDAQQDLVRRQSRRLRAEHEVGDRHAALGARPGADRCSVRRGPRQGRSSARPAAQGRGCRRPSPGSRS